MLEVALSTPDGLSLFSWYCRAQERQPTVLILHGNAGNIDGRMPLAQQFMTSGFGVFLLEYRGYGSNPGSPTEAGLYDDARAAMQFLQKQGVPLEQIVIYGESLGTAVATQVASEFAVCAVVLQSPFTSITNLAHLHYPWLLIKPRDKFDSLSRITKVHAPLLVLHGNADTLVPIHEGKTLFAKANEPKTLIAIDDKGHSNLWNQAFYIDVIDFIKTTCEK
jgi:fermentation-respiration switch protein FrsA (DUF1100 family)